MGIDKEIEEVRKQLELIIQLLQASLSPCMTTREAAIFLRCSPSKIEEMTNFGLLPFQRLDPTAKRSPRLYNRRDLTAFLVTGNNPREHRLSQAEKRLVEELL